MKTLLWLLYIICSAFFYCLGNVAEKIIVSKYVKNTSFYGYTLITFLMYGLFAFFLFPFAHLETITPFILLLIVVRSITNLLFYYFWIKLMIEEEISRLIGILFIYPLITFFLDYLLFKTELSILFYCGALLMIASALLMLYKPSKNKFVKKKYMIYLIIIVAIWGIYGVLLKLITTKIDITTFLFLETTSAFIIAIIITSFSKTIQQQIKEFFVVKKTFWIAVFCINFFYFLALALSFLAYNLGQVSVSLLASFEILQPSFVFIITVFLSFFFPHILNEEIDKKTIIYKVIALALLIAGIILIFNK